MTDGRQHLLLRAFGPQDTAALTAAFTDPEIARWITVADGDGDGGVEAWWTGRNDPPDDTQASWAVSDADGALVGSLSLLHIDLTQLVEEVGYFVVPAMRGRGVARWAVAAACDHAFGTLGLRRVQLFHAVDNHASCRVALAAGFPQEGVLRSSYRYSDGLWHDEHLHARLSAD